MLASRYIAMGFLLINYAAMLVALGTEPVPRTKNNGYGKSFRDLKQKAGQVVRHLLGMEGREEFIYYGDYQAYGNYGNYGVYGGSGGSGGGGSGSSTTKPASQASSSTTSTQSSSIYTSILSTTSTEPSTSTSAPSTMSPPMSTSTSTSTITSYSTTVTSTLSVPTIISQSSQSHGPAGNLLWPLLMVFVQWAAVGFL